MNSGKAGTFSVLFIARSAMPSREPDLEFVLNKCVLKCEWMSLAENVGEVVETIKTGL